MRYLVLSLFMGISPFAVAQDYLPSTDMVKTAIIEQPSLAVSKAQKRAAAAQALALSIGPYEWTLNGDFARRSTNVEGDSSEFEFGVSRSFRWPGKAALDREIGKLGIKQADLAFEDTRHEAARKLLMLWMNWLAANEQVNLAKAQTALFQSDVETLGKGVERGQSAPIAYDMARSALEGAQKTLVEAQTAAELIAAELRTLFPALALPVDIPTISSPEPLSDPDSWVGLMMSRNHEIMRYEAAAKMAEQSARRTRLDRYADPELGLRTFSERDGDETGLGVFVSIPIGGNYRKAELSKALELSSASRFEAENVRRQRMTEARQAVIGASMQYTSWEHSVAALSSEIQARDRMRKGFEIGAISYQELQQQEKRLTDRRVDELMARASVSLSQLLVKVDAHELWLNELDEEE